MPKATLQFGELRPDLALLDNQFANLADNVFPFSNTYKPIPSLLPITTAALPSSCLGLFAARKKDGTWQIYAGTATKLYQWTYGGWVDMTNPSTTQLPGGHYSVPQGERWVSDQFGTSVVAVQLGNAPQVIDTEAVSTVIVAAVAAGGSGYAVNDTITLSNSVILKVLTISAGAVATVSIVNGGSISGALPPNPVAQVSTSGSGTVATFNLTWTANFTNLAGNPPLAHGCKVIGDFLFLYGLASDRYAVQWSGVNDVTQWTIGTNLCDIQHFPDMGPVVGVAGSEVVGYVVQDRGIRSLQFLPGDINFIFTFARIVKERGSISEFGYASNADVLYFLAEDGFYALAGSQLAPIGFEKINETFLAGSDVNRRNIVQCFTAAKPYVIWAFHSNAGAQTYDRVMLYNWANQRWATGTIKAQMWAMVSTIPLDLDTDDPTDPTDPDLDSNSAELDSFKYLGGRPTVCAVNENGQLCSLAGPNLSATLQTAEVHLIPGMRAFCSEVYPLVDSVNATVVVQTREQLGYGVTISVNFPMEITGFASVLTSARLHRFTLNIPFGEPWTNAQGLLAEADPDGYA